MQTKDNGLIAVNCKKDSKYSADGLCEFIADYVALRRFDDKVTVTEVDITGADIKHMISLYEKGKRNIFEQPSKG